MRRSCFNAKAQGRRGFAGFFKALALSVMCLAAFAASADIEYDNEATVRVETLEDLQTALQNREEMYHADGWY